MSSSPPVPGPIHLVGSGHAHPEGELTSRQLARTVPGLREGWSEEYLGIDSRRVLGVGENINTLLVDAASDALAMAGWSGDRLDLIVCGTALPDQLAPPAASYVARAHRHHMLAFDVQAGCASFLYGLSTAAGLVLTAGVRNAIVCAGEHATAYADYTDPHSSVFWGDAAGAVALTVEQPSGPSFEMVDIVLNGDHEFPEKVLVPRNGHFRSDGRFSFGQVLELGSTAIESLYERNDIGPDDVAGIVVHQANRRILEAISDRVGIPFERQWHNYEWAGNQAAAGVVTAFSQGWQEHRHDLRDEDCVILVAVGAGYSGAAVLLRWNA